MTAKIPVANKGPITEKDEWRMGLNISKVVPTDLIEIDKPKTSVTQKSITGKKDKARGKLALGIKQTD
jgi:hypothetical protein